MYESKKKYFYGTGRRKEAIAHVWLTPAEEGKSGKITINRRSFEEYLPTDALQNVVLQPFYATNTMKKFREDISNELGFMSYAPIIFISAKKGQRVDKLFSLTTVLVGSYVVFAFQNVCDATFYGLGKTKYMLFESVVTNTVYYGIAFVLYATGLWTPTLTGIALLFGIGNAFDSVVSWAAYVHLLKKRNMP